MPAEDINAKGKIYQATLALITGGEDADRLTVRRIAAEAGVNAALINYYYQSKENLISLVVGSMMGEIMHRASRGRKESDDARTRLRDSLLTTGDAAFQYHHVCKIALSIELKNGCRNSCDMILPQLAEIFPGRPQSRLRIAALQLMLPFHHIVTEPELYGAYFGVDFFDPVQRRRKIHEMIDCVIAATDGTGPENDPIVGGLS